MAMYVLASLLVCLVAALLWPRMIYRDFGVRQWERRQQALRTLAGTDGTAGRHASGAHVRVLGDPAGEADTSAEADTPAEAPAPDAAPTGSGAAHYGRVHTAPEHSRVVFRYGFRRKRRHADRARMLQVMSVAAAPGPARRSPGALRPGGGASRSHRRGCPPAVSARDAVAGE